MKNEAEYLESLKQYIILAEPYTQSQRTIILIDNEEKRDINTFQVL